MMKTFILIYHQHGHIAFTTNIFLFRKTQQQSTIGRFNESLKKMLCQNENILSSEFYSAKIHY